MKVVQKSIFTIIMATASLAAGAQTQCPSAGQIHDSAELLNIVEHQGNASIVTSSVTFPAGGAEWYMGVPTRESADEKILPLAKKAASLATGPIGQYEGLN